MMSSKTFRNIFKYFLFTLVFVMFCAFQSSFWSILIDFLPAPQLWLIFLIFVFLKWPGFSTVFYAYGLGFILILFSAMPLKMSWLSILGLYCYVWIFKTRIHSSSLFLFSVLCGSASLFYSMFYIFLSYLLEQKMTPFLFFERLLDSGMTFLSAFPIYLFLDFINKAFAAKEVWSPVSKDLNSHLGDL